MLKRQITFALILLPLLLILAPSLWLQAAGAIYFATVVRYAKTHESAKKFFDALLQDADGMFK